MLIVYETGEGIPHANSYIDNSDVDSYLVSSGKIKWDELSDDEKKDRLITASQFIDNSFNWVGIRKTFEQGLSWPRLNVMYQGHEVPDTIIPVQIRKACILALNLLIENGIDFFISTGEGSVKREKLAVMEQEYFAPKDERSSSGMMSDFTDINNLLRGFYVKANNGMIIAEVLRA